MNNISVTTISDHSNMSQAKSQLSPDLPIASEATKNEQEQPGRPNKYGYPIFADYSGERYLDSILMKILPAALWRTWKYAVYFQAPGKECYVGTDKIAERVKPGKRKIEMDFHELESRGLMRKYADRQPVMQQDGTFAPAGVVVKNFFALYSLAYEYHLWTLSPEYIPPERDFVDLICQDQKLYNKLIRFDNYRRILVNEKPGRKPQPTAIHLAYQCQLPPDAQELGTDTQAPVTQQETRTNHLKANNYCNTPAIISSPYREPKKEEDISESSSISTQDVKEGFLEPLAIRNEGNATHTDTNEVVQNSNNEPENREEQTQPETSKSKHTEPPTEEETSPEAAKDEKEYTIEDLKKNPFAMAAFLVDMQAQQIQQPKAAKRSQKKQPQRKRRGTPEQLSRYIAYIVQQLGGNPKSQQSDITRATKLYWAATQIFNGFTNAWFLDILREVFIETCRVRGVKRRVPYFFKCLETKLELTPDELVFIRSDEPLYQDGDITDFKTRLRKTYEKSGTHLEYLEWVQQNYLSQR